MRIYSTVTKMKLDKTRMTKALLAIVDNIFLDAIESFSKEAAAAVPVFTGMARGSFLNMRTFLESKGRVLSDIPEVAQAVQKSGKPYRYVHTTAIGRGKNRSALFRKEPQTARDYFTTKPNEIYYRKYYDLKFAYEIRVRHYNILDQNAPFPQRTWFSFDQGKRAFLESLKSNKSQLTNWKEFLTTTSVSYGRQYSAESPLRNRSRLKLK